MAKSNVGAIERATARRAVRWEWKLKEFDGKLNVTMKDRVRLATEYLKTRVVQNISVPVVKQKGERSKRTVVTERSKPGEFPRADTVQLLKTIFSDVKETSPGVWDGFVGTPLSYGAILETSKRLDRSFLVRTLNEEKENLTRMLTGPVTG